MKKQFNKALSLFLTVALVLSTFVTCGVLSVAAESPLSATDVVSTTRKTYDFETDMSGVLTNSEATIEDGFLKFAYDSDKKLLLDFPLRNGKQYAVNIVYAVDGLTARGDIAAYGLSNDGFAFGEFDITKTGTVITGVTDKASSYLITKGDKTLLNYNYLFTVPAEIITDVNGRYISMTLKNGAITGKNIYVASITVFEVGAAATFDFDAESDLFFLTGGGINENGTLSIPSGNKDLKAGLAYILEEGTYTVKYTSKMSGDSNAYSLKVAASQRGYADSSQIGNVTTENNTTDYKTYEKSLVVPTNTVTATKCAFYINPSFASANRTLDYDKIFIGKAGGTVKFNGITADDVTGYYGESVDLPANVPYGKILEGWYLDAEYTIKVDGITIPESGETVTLYANIIDNPNLLALKVVPTTRKTYDFETDMSGVLTNSGATIENGFLKFAYGSDKKLLLDFPLRNGKQYGVNIVYAVDGLTARSDILQYRLSNDGFAFGEFDINKTGTAISGATEKVVGQEFLKTKGDKTLLNCNYLFTVPAETITDVNSRYISMTFLNGAATGKNIYVASITVFEVGAAATFDFEAESDLFYLNANGINENGTLSIPSGKTSLKAGLTYILEEGTYTVKYTSKMAGDKYAYTLVTGTSQRAYPTINQISSSTENNTENYQTYTKTMSVVAANITGTGANTTHAFYINPSFASANRTLDYDKIFIGKAGGTVKFNGITADDVTGYYGEKVAIPSAPIGYSYELYLDAGYNVAIDAATIPASGETLNLYVKQVKKDTMIFDFADESHLDLACSEQNVKIQNGALSLYNISGSQSSARIPYKFESDKDYYILLDYTISFTEPAESAKVVLQLHYSANDITNYKHSGAYLYEYGVSSNPAKANIQEFDSKAFSTSDESGSLAFTFKTPSEFKTLYTDNAWTEAHIMDTLGFTMQPDSCTGATITIDNIEIGIRKSQQPPATPIIEEKGVSSITLTNVAGCEYSINGFDWQDSTEFTGLFAGNSYTLSQRYKETVKLLPSDVTTLNYNLVMRGDSDADGKITGVDLVEIRKALLGVLVIKDTDFDFNYDNTFDIRDLVAIKKFTVYSTSSDLMIGSNPIEDFNVISDTDLISIQARDELIEAMNSFKEGSVKASDTISGTNDIILSIDYDNMDTDNYELKVENNVITLKAGSNYALLEGARALAIHLSEIADGKIVRFVNGYVLRGSYVGLEYQGSESGKYYTLSYNDEFNSGSINTKNWNYSDNHTWTEDDGAVRDSANLEMTDSSMIINCGKDDAGKYGYSIASVSNFSRGYFEARMKLPAETGCWSAFWLNGIKGTSDEYAYNEIDIYEANGKATLLTNKRDAKGAVHYWSSNGDVENHCNTEYNTAFDNEYHIYALEWTETQLKFFVDGYCFKTVDLTSEEYFAPLLNGDYMKIRIGALGRYIDTNKNLQIETDYVRYYQ